MMRDEFFQLFFLLLICILPILITKCATQHKVSQPVRTTELPVFQGDIDNEELHLSVVFRINGEGKVKEVRLETSSGDSEWDAMAVDSLKQWRFHEPPTDTNGVVVRKNVRVKLLPSEVMNLGKLVARDEEAANVLYNRLRAGISFENLLRQALGNSSLGKSGQYMENVNTMDYPVHISKVLLELDTGNYTRPVQMEGEYVIFKRYGDRLP